MNETIRVYYNEQCIFFTENANQLVQDKGLNNAWLIRNFGKNNLQHYFLQLIETNLGTLIFEGNISSLFMTFRSEFMLVEAGGGVVWNEANELLMIHRLGKWDLPKGKLDEGESIESCAIREVEEETGLQNISLQSEATLTYHLYFHNDNWILKPTYWYQMKAPKQELVPQAAEDITQAVWVQKNEITEKLENSYPNIIYLLKDFL